MYKRFLNKNDYLSILTDEALDQLIRGREDRLAQAEEASEASIVEYLTDKFEIEEALKVGKAILPYNKQISYPVGAHFVLKDKIVRAIRPISGNQRPSVMPYWEELELDEFNEIIMTDREEEEAEDNVLLHSYEHVHRHDHGYNHHPHNNTFDLPSPDKSCYHHNNINQPPHHSKSRLYSQRANYAPGDIAMFNDKPWLCLEYNGPMFNDIRVPGITGWEEVEAVTWHSMVEYDVNTVVNADDKFYALLSLVNYDPSVHPSLAPDNVWGLIGEYNEDEKLEFSNTEWVVCDGKVFIPAMAPNASELREGYNYAYHDPRNSNIKKHLLQMAVYELHKLISPHNISTVRITDYEASLQWLQDASRLRINPGIRRKIDEEGKHVTEFAVATFRRDYDPHKNEWQI